MSADRDTTVYTLGPRQQSHVHKGVICSPRLWATEILTLRLNCICTAQVPCTALMSSYRPVADHLLLSRPTHDETRACHIRISKLILLLYQDIYLLRGLTSGLFHELDSRVAVSIVALNIHASQANLNIIALQQIMHKLVFSCSCDVQK